MFSLLPVYSFLSKSMIADLWRKIRGQPTNRNLLEKIMSKLSEITATLKGVDETQKKALGEINTRLGVLTQRIADLESQLGDVELNAEQQAALDAVVASAKALDDVIPDTPTPPA